jgi:hypothetical protein
MAKTGNTPVIKPCPEYAGSKRGSWGSSSIKEARREKISSICISLGAVFGSRLFVTFTAFWFYAR